jgi:hypothetical protein
MIRARLFYTIARVSGVLAFMILLGQLLDPAVSSDFATRDWHVRPVRRVSSFEKVPESSKRVDAVADDFGDREHWCGQNRARHAPHPVPEY